MASYLLVAIGSALGGVTRFWLNDAVEQRVGTLFPWGILVVNIVGSFLIGLAAGIVVGLTERDAMRHFVMVGFLGGFTTFSAFSLQTLSLGSDGRYAAAAFYVIASVLGCLFAVWLGYTLVRR